MLFESQSVPTRFGPEFGTIPKCIISNSPVPNGAAPSKAPNLPARARPGNRGPSPGPVPRRYKKPRARPPLTWISSGRNTSKYSFHLSGDKMEGVLQRTPFIYLEMKWKENFKVLLPSICSQIKWKENFKVLLPFICS